MRDRGTRSGRIDATTAIVGGIRSSFWVGASLGLRGLVVRRLWGIVLARIAAVLGGVGVYEGEFSRGGPG